MSSRQALGTVRAGRFKTNIGMIRLTEHLATVSKQSAGDMAGIFWLWMRAPER